MHSHMQIKLQFQYIAKGLRTVGEIKALVILMCIMCTTTAKYENKEGNRQYHITDHKVELMHYCYRCGTLPKLESRFPASLPHAVSRTQKKISFEIVGQSKKVGLFSKHTHSSCLLFSLFFSFLFW